MTDDKYLSKYVTEKLRDYENKFEVLRWIDKAIIDNELHVEDFVAHLVTRIQQISQGAKVAAYIISDGEFILIGPHSFADTPGIQDKIDLNKLAHGIIVRDKKSMTIKLIEPIMLENKPLFILHLEDVMHDPPIAHLENKDFQKFIKTAASQAGIMIRAIIERRLNDNKQKVIELYFKSLGDPDRYWEIIAKLCANFLPGWGIFKLDPEPMVQILVHRPKEMFIELRASNVSSSNNEIRYLKRQDTICGLFLDMNESDHLPYLYVNPTESKYSSRYASYYNKAAPNSELVLPVYHPYDENIVIGLINLEHTKPNAFKEYHIEAMKMASKFIGPFINALIHEEEDRLARLYSLRYVMAGILTRIGKVYHHKIGNSVQKAKSAIDALKIPCGTIDQRYLPAYNNLDSSVMEFASLSTGFLTGFDEFVNYDEVDVLPLLHSAIKDLNLENQIESGEIKITTNNAPGNIPKIFASLLLREHFYNILNNSTHAIRKRYANNEINEGKIAVNIFIKKQYDLKNNEQSFPFIVVSIQDNGGGVSKENMDRIFTPGFSTKKLGEGTGFGMSAAQEYMRTIGGDIILQNNEGIGLTVSFSCPQYQNEIHDALKFRLNIKRFNIDSKGSDS